MSNLIEYVKNILLPPRCVICDRVIAPAESPLCPRCAKMSLPYILGEACKSCGREKTRCRCKYGKSISDGIAATFYYEQPIKGAIGLYKRIEDNHRTVFFTKEMLKMALERYGDKQVDYITAVPMRRRDKLARGFDQVIPLARALSRAVYVPYVPLLKKLFDTPPQKSLRGELRKGNVLGAFDVKTKVSLKGKTILLIDDVVTSGATTDECAKMLKIYGAARVYVLTLAVTKPKERQEQ